MHQRVGRFEILKRLGQGAMGEVYLARDPGIGREVAIKTIHREAAQGAEARERFAREAQAAGTLNHPNLVTIHEFGEDQGLLYLAMEYVPGVDLEALLRDRVLAPTEVMDVLAQVCDGLAHAHQKGVLHRDIKPSNIRVRRDGERLQVKVMDFGIARITASDLTGTGTLLGTFGYMAPEYIKSGVADPRCDLFAVGVILYEALAGHRPFEGDTTATVLYRLVHEEPAPLSPASIRGLSPRVDQLLAKALAKEPAWRFPTAEAFAASLRAASHRDWPGLPSAPRTRPRAQARPNPDTPAPGSPSAPTPVAGDRRNPWPWVAVTLTLGAAGWGVWTWVKRPPAPRLITLPPPAPPTTGEAEPPNPMRTAAPRSPARLPPSRTSGLSELQVTDLLNAAARGLVDQPQGSLDRCEQVLRDHPAQARAHALKVVALYGLGRYADIPRAIEACRTAGVSPSHLLGFAAFQAMLREDRRDHRLPPEVRAALLSALRLGPGFQGRSPQRG